MPTPDPNLRSSALFSRQPSGGNTQSTAQQAAPIHHTSAPSPVTPETPAPPLTLAGAAQSFPDARSSSGVGSSPGRPIGSAHRGPKRGLSLATSALKASNAHLDAPPQTAVPPELKALLSPKGASHDRSLGFAVASSSSSEEATSSPSNKERKRPARLSLAPPVMGSSEARSAPSSPMYLTPVHSAGETSSLGPTQDERREDEAKELLRETLRGTPRRRPSMPFGRRPAPLALSNQIPPKKPSHAGDRRDSAAKPPSVWQDPSEHILSGKGSTLQHARSVYASGPVEILPGLFLGDEHNACDAEMLSDLGITMILNVAKETDLPFQKDAADVGSLASARPSGLPTGPLQSAIFPARASRSGSLSGDDLLSPQNFYTPVTSVFPPNTPLPPSISTSTARGAHRSSVQYAASSLKLKEAQPVTPPHYLRSTLSTPNLQQTYKGKLSADGSSNSREPSPLKLGTPRAPEADDLERLSRSCGHTGERSASPQAHRTAGEDASEAGSAATSWSTSSSVGGDEASASWTSSRTTPSSSPSAEAHDMRTVEEAQEVGAPAVSVADDLTPRRDDLTSKLFDKQSSSGSETDVVLPAEAIALSIPASPLGGRMQALRYVKLPWTHDETELAAPGGGFSVGCALIAECLQVGSFTPVKVEGHSGGVGDQADVQIRTMPKQRPSPGRILVHCQCGVSRSATLVIAFVMEAAALGYPLEGAQGLSGMHDCYTLVKDLSASISPNCSLIYQLVEWERHLSAEVNRLRVAFGIEGDSHGADDGRGVTRSGIRPATGGWAGDAMDEEEWTRMRQEEERKEAVEEDRRREERLAAAREAAAQKLAAENLADDGDSKRLVEGIGARRNKKTPSLKLGGAASLAVTTAAPGVLAALPSAKPRKGPPKPLQLNAQAPPVTTSGLATKAQTPSLGLASGATLQPALKEPVHEEEEDEAVTPSASQFSALRLDNPSGPSVAPVQNASSPPSGAQAQLLRSQSDGAAVRRTAIRPSPKHQAAHVDEQLPEGEQANAILSASSSGSSINTILASASSPSISELHLTDPRRKSVHGLGARTPRAVDPRRRSVQVVPSNSSPRASIGAHLASAIGLPGTLSFSAALLTPSKSLHSGFGASRQSASERKDRHRRTFSSDLPASLRAFSREVGQKLDSASAARAAAAASSGSTTSAAAQKST
ncbi:protein tyrosine phosphatase [Ceraceosorus bombacis]|uniref:protein-tyrosine-phosphatase n=1 Tax=Ceraceosorus bombacis TaxID=401625 RepID=A0A0P1B8T1_9BASI|nr:protein tyrosine phosphatase [Ceraceosorus bombacis]